MPLTLTSAALTHPGLVRARNEDAYAERAELGFYVLADGMGGHQGGDVASRLTVDTLLSYWKRHKARSVESAEEGLRESLTVANETVAREAAADRNLHGMGSTVCCLLRCGDDLVYAHVGDSRIYLHRDGKLLQLTRDHSLVTQLLASGQISEDEAERFIYKHIITRAIGTRKRVQPDVGHIPLEEGDLYLVCSDGLTDLVPDEEILKLLGEGTLEEQAERLVEAANAAGGNDNTTVLLVQCAST